MKWRPPAKRSDSIFLQSRIRRVANLAMRNGGQILSVPQLLFPFGHSVAGRFEGAGCGPRVAFHPHGVREVHFGGRKLVLDGRNGIQKRHHRLHVLIAHIAVKGVGHDREQRASVFIDAFTDRANFFAIRPRADSGLHIRRDIAGVDLAGQVGVRHQLPLAARGFNYRHRQAGYILFGMAEVTVGDVRENIFAALHAFRAFVNDDVEGRRHRGAAEIKICESAGAYHDHCAQYV